MEAASLLEQLRDLSYETGYMSAKAEMRRHRDGIPVSHVDDHVQQLTIEARNELLGRIRALLQGVLDEQN